MAEDARELGRGKETYRENQVPKIAYRGIWIKDGKTIVRDLFVNSIQYTVVTLFVVVAKARDG